MPVNVNVLTNKLYVQVALLNPAEDYACNMLGVSYPHLKIVDAKI